jgi:hypothetical protein
MKTTLKSSLTVASAVPNKINYLHTPAIENIRSRKNSGEKHHHHQCDKLSLEVKHFCIHQCILT